MQKLYCIVLQLAYFLGLLSLIVGIVLRMLPHLQKAATSRGFFVFAGVLFLCALASSAMSRPKAS